jgi:hypothetical protein
MRSHQPGTLPRKQRLRRQFMLVVAGCLMLETAWTAADEPAPPPRIVMIRGAHRSEYTVHKVEPEATASPSTSAIEDLHPPGIRATDTAPTEGVIPQRARVHDDRALNQAQPDFPQFIRLDDADQMQTSEVIDEFAPVPNAWLPATQGQPDAAHPVEDSATPGQIISILHTVRPTSQGDSQATVPEPLDQEAPLEKAPGSERPRPDIASTSPAQSVPPVNRLSQTTMMKLDSAQAACFGVGILLCLSFQVAIIVVLLRQRHQQPLQMAAALPAYERLNRGRDRTTGVVDFAADTGLWDAAGANIGRKWRLEEDDIRKQEATIVEEVVSMNVTMAHELSLNPDANVSPPE